MLKNDILRRVRYILDLSDDQMIALFALGGKTVNRQLVSSWLKKDDAEDYETISDQDLSVFLNGLIIDKRGKKDDSIPKPEKKLSNNLVFRKLNIALSLKSEDIIKILKLADFDISKHELSAFFRKPEHRNYQDCKAQVLRKFLTGLNIYLRG